MVPHYPRVSGGGWGESGGIEYGTDKYLGDTWVAAVVTGSRRRYACVRRWRSVSLRRRDISDGCDKERGEAATVRPPRVAGAAERQLSPPAAPSA